MRFAAGALIVCAFLLIPASPSVAGAKPLTVCTFSFNTADEVDAFKAWLPAKDFELIDLSPPPLIADHTQASIAPTDWLAKSCRADLHCDVVVISAEFAGRFFGARGMSMGMHEMEEASCQASCNGLFHAPREVFLLACNTLATKDLDRRTPREYLQVLMDHGFDRGTAERVTSLRYGPLGPSFREALRRIFHGVPRIYGFTSLAPAGDYTAKALGKYFRSKGNYRAYLERAGRSPQSNRELLAAFRITDMAQVAGLTERESANADRAQICALYDETIGVAERLRIIHRLLDRSDFLAFLPSIQVFVQRHPADQMIGEERRLFDKVRASARARDRVLELVRQSEVSALKMELAYMAVGLEWMTRAEFRRLVLDGTHKLISEPLTLETVDIMCAIAEHEPIGDEIPFTELPKSFFQTGEGIRFVHCLRPRDPQVTTHLLPALESTDLWTRLWAAYAISQRMPLSDAILVELARHLSESPGMQQDRLQWIFRVQPGVSDEVRRAVARRDPQLASLLPDRARAGGASLRPGR